MPGFPLDAFAGTAVAYLKYRPAYPEAMLSDLRARAGSTGHGILLDLGCGPGRVALPLASHFKTVTAVDIEPEMIAVGRAEAARLGIRNVEWHVGRAEAVPLPSRTFDLVTCGESFHRLDKGRILERVKEWLVPGGSFATMGLNIVFQGEAPWHRVVCDVMRKWTGGWAGPKPRAEARKFWTHDADLLSNGFNDVHSHEFLIPHVWKTDDIIGYLDATSGSSRRRLGADAEACHAELRKALRDFDPAGRYPDTLWFAYTLAKG